MKVGPLGTDRNFAEGEVVAQEGSQRPYSALEIAKRGADAAIVRDLLVMITRKAKSEFL